MNDAEKIAQALKNGTLTIGVGDNKIAVKANDMGEEWLNTINEKIAEVDFDPENPHNLTKETRQRYHHSTKAIVEEPFFVTYSVAWFSEKHDYYRTKVGSWRTEDEAKAEFDQLVQHDRDTDNMGVKIAVFKEWHEAATDSGSIPHIGAAHKQMIWHNPNKSLKSKTVKVRRWGHYVY